MAISSIEQGRASYAYNCAQKGSELEKSKEYKAYVRKIPALIRTNGLGATLAFIASKKSDDPAEKGYAYLLIYRQIQEWLVSRGFFPQGVVLEQKVVELDSAQYRLVTTEVLSLFKWLARFAEALIEGENDE